MKAVIIYYSVTNHTKTVAEEIQRQTSADIKVIELVRSYSFVGSLTRGLIDTYRKVLPELKGEINLCPYDIVYVGGPTWGYNVNPILKSFLLKYNLEGKIVIPFCSDQGAPGKFFEEFKELSKGAIVKPGHEFIYPKRKSKEELRNEVERWIALSNNSIHYL